MASPATPDIQCVVRSADILGEVPLWCDRTARLWWVDVRRPALQWFDPRTGEHAAQRLPQDLQVGSIALREQGGFLLATNRGIFGFDPADGQAPRLLHHPEPDKPEHRLNDGKTDRRGRFWVGSMLDLRRDPEGTLYRFDPDHSCHAMLDGFVLPNSIAWSPDDWPAMIVANYGRTKGAAAASRMWVYAIDEPLPPLEGLETSTRKLDLFIPLAFLATRDYFGHNHPRSIEHMVQYCRHVGINSVTMMVYANQGWGAMCTIPAWDTDDKGFLDDILTQMDRAGGVELIAGIVADGMYGKTRAGGRLATGGYGGNLSLNPHGEAARFIMPVARSLVDGEGQGRPTLIASDAQLNLLTETAVPQALEAWPETWTAVQGRARGDFAAWIWRREGVARAKVSHGMMRSLESESRELAAGALAGHRHAGRAGGGRPGPRRPARRPG